uniref:Protein kinase domain-containing protein n=1 Tax=Oryza meridionalis TaxID=40149 RepID=A0A0E0CQU4_9ORYZ
MAESGRSEEFLKLYIHGVLADGTTTSDYRLLPAWEFSSSQRVVAASTSTTSQPSPSDEGEPTGWEGPTLEVEKLASSTDVDAGESSQPQQPARDGITMVSADDCVYSLLPMVPIAVSDPGTALPDANSYFSISIHPVEGRCVLRHYQNRGSEKQWVSTSIYYLALNSLEDDLGEDPIELDSPEDALGKDPIELHGQISMEIHMPPLMMKFQKDYRSEKQIGKGSEGRVYKCTSRFSPHCFAIKEVESSELTMASTHCEPTDVSILALLDHVNIVDLYSAWIEKKKSFGSVTNVIYICMKECARSLSEYLNKRQELGLQNEHNMFAQLIDSLIFMHRHGIVHRDVKPGNILLEENFTVKLADFGIAKKKQPPYTIDFHGGWYGSLPYRAPERVNSYDRHDEKVDIFSIGMVYFELLMPGKRERKRKLNKLSETIRRKKQEYDQLDIEFDLDSALEGTDVLTDWKGDYNLLKKVISPNAWERLSAVEIKEHFSSHKEG